MRGEIKMEARSTSRVWHGRNDSRVGMNLFILAPLILSAMTLPAAAQTSMPAAPANAPQYLPKAWQSALTAPGPVGSGIIGVAPTIGANEQDLDAQGLNGTYQPGGAVTAATNAFFQSLGTNGRSCATCHQPAEALSVSLPNIQARYLLTGGKDPIFAPVDGANCPNQVPAANTSPSYLGRLLGKGRSMASAHSLVLTRGVFRIFLPVPANAEYTIAVVSDPTTCNTDPSYNQVIDPATGTPTQIISVYRRPRISTNLKYVTTTIADVNPFVIPPNDPITGVPLAIDPYTGIPESGNIMWDGREPTLQSQAIDATLSHAQAIAVPTAEQVAQMVAFETGIYSAQSYSFAAGELTASGGLGGPVNLSATAPGQLLSLAPAPHITPYSAWSTIAGKGYPSAQQESIYRGQQIFNTRTFTISGVAGLNNIAAIGNPTVNTCGVCHNQINIGNDAFPAAQHDIGVSGSFQAFGGVAPAKDLPIFQITCKAGASSVYAGTVLMVNDPGLALITGKCADIGRTTVPQLRGLASRAPYFHDGSAATLRDVVNFYNQRFSIGLSAQDTTDLVNFLNAL